MTAIESRLAQQVADLGILQGFGWTHSGDRNFEGFEGGSGCIIHVFNAAEIDFIRTPTYRDFSVGQATIHARRVQREATLSHGPFVERNAMAIKQLPRNWPGKISRLLHAKPVCPMCTSIEFRRSPARALDRMLQLVNLIPLQCTNCWRYFYWMRDDSVFTSQADRADWMN